MTDASANGTQRYRITITDGSAIDDFGAISDELEAFWTFGPHEVITAEFVITAKPGLVEAFEDESELPGVVIEEVAEYEE